MKIAIDTNIFIYAARFRLDLFAQFAGNEIFATESVVRELEKIGKGKSRDAKAAAFALSMMKEKTRNGKIEVLKSETESADEGLLELGKKGYVVITQDRELVKRLKANGCAFAYIRQRKYFAFEGAKSI